MRDKEYYDANCMGYALGINEWLRPRGDWNSRAKKMPRFKKSVEALLEKYPLKKVLKREEMELGKSYILYREADTDFHFVLRTRTGRYYEKMGSSPIKRMKRENVWSKSWTTPWNNYNTPIQIFEVLR